MLGRRLAQAVVPFVADLAGHLKQKLNETLAFGALLGHPQLGHATRHLVQTLVNAVLDHRSHRRPFGTENVLFSDGRELQPITLLRPLPRFVLFAASQASVGRLSRRHVRSSRPRRRSPKVGGRCRSDAQNPGAASPDVDGGRTYSRREMYALGAFDEAERSPGSLVPAQDKGRQEYQTARMAEGIPPTPEHRCSTARACCSGVTTCHCHAARQIPISLYSRAEVCEGDVPRHDVSRDDMLKMKPSDRSKLVDLYSNEERSTPLFVEPPPSAEGYELPQDCYGRENFGTRLQELHNLRVEIRNATLNDAI